MVEADFGWNDIGSWRALWEVAEKDPKGNVVSGDVLLEDVENCLIRSEDTLVAAIGLRDTLVVETSDAVLVAPMDRSQDVKKIVNKLKKQNGQSFIAIGPSIVPGAAIPLWKSMIVSKSNVSP